MITTSKVKAWIDAGKDNYEIAQALIDNAIGSYAPVSLSDLPDTATLADGLDEIEGLLMDEEYQIAFEEAKNTANANSFRSQRFHFLDRNFCFPFEYLN